MKVRYINLTESDTLGFYGRLTVEVALGGSLDCALHDVVMAIDKCVNDMEVKAPIITIDADGEPTEFAPDILELIGVYQSRNWLVIGKALGFVYPRWFSLCNYTVALINGIEAPWLRYKVTELRYSPADEEKLIEPGAIIEPQFRSLYLTKQLEARKVFGFTTRSVHSWAIVQQHKAYSVPIWTAIK